MFRIPAAIPLTVTLTWIPASTAKVEQLIGDCDYGAQAKTGQCVPTTSRTATRARVLGTDIGSSFESQGRVIFLFGDTIGPTEDYGASDTMASSTSTDPAAGLFLDFFVKNDGTPYFVHIATWNPYTIVMMRSDFAISRGAARRRSVRH